MDEASALSGYRRPGRLLPRTRPQHEGTRALCAECRVTKQCLDYALLDEDCTVNGIWAGTSPQRREMKRDCTAA